MRRSAAYSPSSIRSQFDKTADARPPIEGFQFPDTSDVRYVRASLRFYADKDQSGTFDPAQDELLQKGLCYEGAPLVLRFSDTPRTVALARETARLGWTTGWRFVTGEYEASTEIERGDLRWYRYDDSCDR